MIDNDMSIIPWLFHLEQISNQKNIRFYSKTPIFLEKSWFFKFYLIGELKNKKEGIFAGYASNNKVIRQLIDLALLQNNMLKGEALNNFVKRSIELI